MAQVPSTLHAVMSALRLSHPDCTGLENQSDEEWTATLAFCDTAHLTLSIAQLSTAKFPPWVVERLQRSLSDNTQRFERVKKTYREAAEALDQAGIEFIVIKGFTQSPDYVEDPRMRAQNDIDLFCPPMKIELARSALRKIGYRPCEAKLNLTNADHDAALERLGDWKWKGNRYDPEMPLSIELHRCLWNEQISKVHIPETALFWQRRMPREIDGFSFICLDPVDHLAHLSLHILRNILLGGLVIHHVRELAFFLHTHADDDAFWQRWSASQSERLRSYTAIAFDYARRWFGCRLHAIASEDVSRISPMCKRWLNRFPSSSLEAMFLQNKDHLWLHINLLTSRKDKWEIIQRTLIPPRLASIDSPVITAGNNQPVATSRVLRYRQYLHYLVQRATDHTQGNLSTLARGLRWYLSYSIRCGVLLWVKRPLQ